MNASLSQDCVPRNTMDQEKQTAEFWRSLVPTLHVLAPPPLPPPPPTTDATSQSLPEVGTDNSMKHRLREEGYFTTKLGIANDLPTLLANGISQLRAAGWPASFILMYDEAWVLSKSADHIMDTVAGNTNNGDMLAWDIDPNRDEAGFSPHRDRQPADISSSFHTNGMPKYSTAWIALTDATPENSCLYMIPKQFDPGYDHPGDVDNIDPLERCLPDKTCYQNIRALPIEHGHGIFFSHRILHWGSRGRKGYAVPRMALSVACSVDSFEPSYFADKEKQLPFPELNVRLGLICGQMICYHERFNFDTTEIRFFTTLWRKLSGNFSSFYQQKVLKDLIPAIEDAMLRGKAGKMGRGEVERMNGKMEAAKGGQKWEGREADGVDKVDEDEDDDMLDAALDAMLEGGNEMDFRDDFDDGGEGLVEAEIVVEVKSDGGEEEEEEPLAKRQKVDINK